MDSASAMLSFLAGVAIRSAVVALLPLVLLAVFRRRLLASAASRHAVLFLAAAGMIAMAVLQPLLPAIPVRILAAPDAASQPALPAPDLAVGADTPGLHAVTPAAPRVGLGLAAAVDALYLAGLALCLIRLLFGALFTRRLLRAAVPIEADFGAEAFESSWISVPLTVGWLRPRLLLPAGWRDWPSAKLQAVLAHEQNHIRRADWAISLVAALNRSLYWFNPLAWQIERRLSALAEQACDDAALLALGQRESYAQALLDMATAVRTGQGRLVWEAMAMAKGAEVRMRIERILDDTRPIPRGLSRSRWMALAVCSLPLIYFTAALRPAPAQSRESDRLPPAIAELLRARTPLTSSGAAQLEHYLNTAPDDLQAREQLILYYFSTGVREPRIDHIDWLIANHPDSKEASLTSLGITPRASSYNTTADYQHAADLWRQQASARPGDETVLINAGRFFAQPGADPNEAERLFFQASALRPNASPAAGELAKLYANAILATSGDPRFPNENPDFNNRVRSEIENLKDSRIVLMTGLNLLQTARLPKQGETLPPGTLNLAEHPLLAPISELGARLATAARPDGDASPDAMINAARAGVLRGQVVAPGAIAPRQPQAPSADAAAPVPALSPAPPPVSMVPPVYPPLARQARIQGVVAFAVVISGSGQVTKISVLRGHPLLVQAAMDAIRQWVYPSGQAGTFQADVNFALPAGEAAPSQAVGRSPGNFQGAVAGTEPKPAAPERIKVGGNVQSAMLVKHVDPDYPVAAKEAGIQGVVTLAVIIGKDGAVESVTADSGHPALIQAAMDAVRQWQYKPTLLNGDPVEVSTIVTVPFQLNP